jgi:hypothetical protein
VRNRELKQLNKLFGEHLGRNPYGASRIAWKWSPELVYPFKIGADVLETGVLTPDGKPLYRVDKRCEMRPTVITRVPVWVLCKWFWHSMDEWVNAIGDKLPWPREGYYIKLLELGIGQVPNRTITEELIAAFKVMWAETPEEDAAKVEAAFEAKERAADSRLDSMIKDSFPAMLKIPGSHGGETELYGRGLKEAINNEDDHQRVSEGSAGPAHAVQDVQ